MLPQPASRTPSLVRRAAGLRVSGLGKATGCWGPHDRWVLAQYTCPNPHPQEGNRLLVGFFSACSGRSREGGVRRPGRRAPLAGLSEPLPAVALLVLRAGSAPARIVAADPVAARRIAWPSSTRRSATRSRHNGAAADRLIAQRLAHDSVGR